MAHNNDEKLNTMIRTSEDFKWKRAMAICPAEQRVKVVYDYEPNHDSNLRTGIPPQHRAIGEDYWRKNVGIKFEQPKKVESHWYLWCSRDAVGSFS